MSNRTRHFDFPATSGFQFPPLMTEDEGDVINLLRTSLRFDDDDADQDDYFVELIHDAAFNGKRIFCHRQKTLWLGQAVAHPQGDVFLDFAPGFLIKGIQDAAFPLDVLKIDGQTIRPKFYARNLSMDNSLRPFLGAVASGTALALQNLTDFELFNYRATGGADITGLPVTGFGDSGITILACNRGRLWAPVITLQPDLGIYISGGGDPIDIADDWGDIDIYGPFIADCSLAIANKRQGRRVTVYGGTVLRCKGGISAITAGGVGPGRELSVIGTRFKRVTSRCIWAQGECKLTVSGVQIEDWGYNPITNIAEPSFEYAMLLDGPPYATIDASFKLRDWVDTGSLSAVQLETFTENSVTYTPIGCRITATIEDIVHGIVEANGITGNIYDLMIDRTVTTIPITFAAGSMSQLIENTVAGVREEHRAGTVMDINRVTTPGFAINIRQDGVTQGQITTTASGKAVFQGAVRPPVYTATTLPATVGDETIIYVSNGDAGSPCLGIGVGGVWRRIVIGAAI